MEKQYTQEEINDFFRERSSEIKSILSDLGKAVLSFGMVFVKLSERINDHKMESLLKEHKLPKICKN